MEILNDLYLSRKALVGFTVIGMAWATYFAQMPVIKSSLDISDVTYGLVVLVSSLGSVGVMFFAPLAQRLAGPFALVLAVFGIGAGFMWVGVAPNAMSLMIALGIVSAGSGIVDVLVNAWIAGIEAQHKRSPMNLNHAAYSFLRRWRSSDWAAREAAWS